MIDAHGCVRRVELLAIRNPKPMSGVFVHARPEYPIADAIEIRLAPDKRNGAAYESQDHYRPLSQCCTVHCRCCPGRRHERHEDGSTIIARIATVHAAICSD